MKKIKDTTKQGVWNDTEASVLGCFLIDNTAFDYARRVFALEPEDFKERCNRKIFEGMIHIHYCKSEPIDMMTLYAEHKRRKWTIDKNYLSHLVSVVPTAANLEHYLKLLKGGEK